MATNIPPDPYAILASELTYHEHLGGGAYGRVYRITLKSSGMTIQAAAKTFQPVKLEDEKESQRREVGFLRKLNHCNIIEFYGTVIDSDELVIVTEYAAKGSLYNYLAEEKINHRQLPQDLVYDWAIQAAKAIAYLQEMKVSHRDIKSPNFVITADDILKLCDFGVAKDLKESISVTSVRGTVRWLAPEVLTEDKLSPASDIFSYGIVVWELQTCDAPYKRMSCATIMYKVCKENMRPAIPANCPAILKMIMQQCWQKDRKKRPHIDEVIADIRRARREGGNTHAIGSFLEDSEVAQSTISQMLSMTEQKGDTHAFGSLLEDSEVTQSTVSQIPNMTEQKDTTSDNDEISSNELKLAKWKVVIEFGKARSGNGELKDPNDIAICQNGDIVITNPGNRCVVVFRSVSKGKYKILQTLTTPENNNNCQPYRPKYLAVTPQGNIWIVSNGGVFNIFDKCGKHLYDYSNSCYDKSWGVTVDAQGHIYVIHGTDDIVVYSENANTKTIEIEKTIKVQHFNGNLYGRLAVNSKKLILLNIEREGYNEVVAINQEGHVVFTINPTIKNYETSQHGMVVDSNDNIFIIVRGTGAAHIHKYSKRGKFLRCAAKLKHKKYKQPLAMAFTPNDSLPVVLCESSVLVLS